MRPRLAPTSRGVALVLVAAALIAVARLTGLADLAAFGVTLALAVIIGLLCALPRLRPVRAERLTPSAPVPVGGQVATVIAISPHPLLHPVGRAALHEDLPAALGRPGDVPLRARLKHQTVARLRGTTGFGDAIITWRDPFGCFQLKCRLDVPGTVTIVPRILELDEGDRELLSRARGSRSLLEPDVDVVPRPYVSGDDPRRVHWPRSAASGTLQVRQRDPGGAGTISLVADLPEGTPRPEADVVVTRVASIASRAVGDGFGLDVRDRSGALLARIDAGQMVGIARLLVILADLGTCGGPAAPAPGAIVVSPRSATEAAG